MAAAGIRAPAGQGWVSREIFFLPWGGRLFPVELRSPPPRPIPDASSSAHAAPSPSSPETIPPCWVSPVRPPPRRTKPRPWPGGVWTVARKERSLPERCAERGWHAGVGAGPLGSSLAPHNLPFPPGFQIKSQQSEVTRILDGKNIKYELVDISQDNALREEMRAKAGNPKAIPPQIVNGDHYCGVRLVLCTGDKHHGGWVVGNNPIPLFLLRMMSRRLSKGVSHKMCRQSADGVNGHLELDGFRKMGPVQGSSG